MSILTQWFGEDMIYTLGWTFFHSIWQGSIVALALAFFLQWTPQGNAGIRYQASMLALFTVLISSVCTFIYYYHASTGSTGLELSPLAYTDRTIGQAATSPAPGMKRWSAVLENYHPFMVALWLSGMVLFTLRMAGGLFYIRHMRKTSRPVAMAGQHILHRLQAKLRFNKRVTIAASPFAKAPMVVGHLKPLILFPIGALNQLTPDELEAVIAHELAHIRRFDYLQNLLQSFIEIIFYYHPAVWWISSVIRAERENTCDDLAVRLCGNKVTYAKALFRLEAARPNAPLLAMPLYTSKNQLFIRIKRILNQPYHKSNTMEKLFATILCIGCFFLLSMRNDPVPSVEMAIEGNPVTRQVSPDHAPDTGEMGFPATVMAIAVDTVPDNATVKTKISRYTDDEQIELTLENGEIIELIVNGKTIPESEFDTYAEKVKDLIAESEKAPPPPPPPTPPGAPHPPGNMDAIPPPPPPPAPHLGHIDQEVIVHKREDDGKRIIRIEKKGPGTHDGVEIIVDGEALFIDGEEISRDTIINGEGQRFKFFGDSMVFRSMPHFEWDFDEDRFHFNGDSAWIGIFKGEDFGEGFQWIPDADWSKDLHIEMRQLKEDLLENREDLKDQMIRLKDNFEIKGMDEEQLRELIEQARGQELRIRKELEHEFEDQHIQHEKIQRLKKRQMEDMERERARRIEEGEHLREEMIGRNFMRPDMIYRGNTAENALIKELSRDGLIDPDAGYTIKMDNRRLRINGEKMPNVLYEKYRKIIQRYSSDEDAKIDIHLKKEVKMKF